jgi:phosphoribosylaminoimidazolecarboxamide formyltransferase/IMP cyclohydrolase
VQERASTTIEESEWTVVTKRAPTEEEYRNLRFAWRAVGSVKSNAIVLVRDGMTIGIGAGQMSRVDAAFMAVHKATTAGHETSGSVLGSDAFFPFRDGVDQAARRPGVVATVQPGGSVRDGRGDRGGG